MPWKDNILAFVKRYGKAAKAVAGGVLNVVAPGSGSLLALVDTACDRAVDVAQDHYEQAMLDATRSNAAELQRLGQLFALLEGELSGLCRKAEAFADQPEDMADVVARAIAADASLTAGLRAVEGLKVQFDAFAADMR